MLTVINSAVRDAQAPGNQREVVAGITATRPNRYTSTRAVTCPRQPRSPPRPPRRSHPACRPCPPGPRAGGCLRPPIPITSPPTSPSPSPSVLATAAANDRGDGNLSPRPREKGGWGIRGDCGPWPRDQSRWKRTERARRDKLYSKQKFTRRPC